MFGAIVGGIIGGVAAIFAVIGIVTFVRRQHRRKPGARTVTVRSQSSSSPSLLPIMTERSMSVPVDLSDEELARLRAEDSGGLCYAAPGRPSYYTEGNR